MADEVVGQFGSEDEGPASETLANVVEASDAVGAAGVRSEDESKGASEEQAKGAETEAAETSVDAPVVEEPQRTTDDIPLEEMSIDILTKEDLTQHRIAWVAWGDKILCRPLSYKGPDFVCSNLEEATRIVPVFG